MEENNNETKAKLSVGFFFINIGVLITLIFSVVSFLRVVFESLNKKYPDILNATYRYEYNSYADEGMRAALATLIIFFPVFLILTYFWKKYSRAGLGKINALIKRWSVYLIIFLSSGMFMTTLAVLVRYFIAGELSTRFSLKVVAVFVTALLVGKFYVFDLLNNKVFGREWNYSNYIFGVVSSLLVVLSIVCSFTLMGSPKEQRLLRIDARKVQDLQSIQYQVINYWQQKEKLPASLEDLNSPLSSYMVPMDPEFESGKEYQYSTKDKETFELCADFNLASKAGWQEDGQVKPVFYDSGMDVSVSYPSRAMNDSWAHDAGLVCFERKIDKDMYPPFKK